MNRLDASAPRLAERVRSADQRTQRAVAAAAAAWAVTATQLNETVVSRAVELLHGGRSQEVRREEISELVEELDAAAWSLQEAEDEGVSLPGVYLAAFGRARAASAVLFASDSEADVAALESVYEACAVASDSSALLMEVGALLDRA